VYNGTQWTNLVGGAAENAPIIIGEPYGGGIVAYILQSGDPGYIAGQTHGLIAATSDQSNGIRWYNGSNISTGATGAAIGTGLSNTNAIISVQGATSTSYAAGVARAHTGGGYSDWYLPSIDEVYKLYLNRSIIGGFAATETYWSSTENGSTTARNVYIPDGVRYNDPKSDNWYHVRAVRSF
jgi:hypothetical protein